MTSRITRIAGAGLLVALLPGCVAALIPVAAGGILAGKDEIGLGGETKAAPIEEMRPAAQLPINSQVILLETNSLPAPGPAGSSVRSSPLSGYGVIAELSAYVENQASLDPVTEPRQSALLADPGSLSGERSECSIRPPAIVVDLDPGAAMFDPAADTAGDPVLAQALQEMRTQDVAIFWASALPAMEAGAVRKRLIANGLDPAGRDGLLLLRRTDDRKQSRRQDLAETHCVIAILGDAKPDFDELYQYLNDPAADGSLDQLLGAGWFLAPSPLLTSINTEGP